MLIILVFVMCLFSEFFTAIGMFEIDCVVGYGSEKGKELLWERL